jgi:hypothetical protein
LDQNKGSDILRWIRTRGFLFCIGLEQRLNMKLDLQSLFGLLCTALRIFCLESEQGECHSALDQNKGNVILRWIRTRGVSFCVVSKQGECYSALDHSHFAWNQNKGSVIVCAVSAHKENVIPCLLLSVLLGVMSRFERVSNSVNHIRRF